MGEHKKLKLLIVDDSAFNRRNIADIFLDDPDVEVVGRAGDGEEALRLLPILKPDVITLDLEMPRMDGFTFLRIVMSRKPVPIIVISSYLQRDNTFKALELGAVDFVCKPDRTVSFDNSELRQAIHDKVVTAKYVKPAFEKPHSRNTPVPPPKDPSSVKLAINPTSMVMPKYLVAIACSTGGPSALLEVVKALPKETSAAYVIAQHMPDKFTRTFSERLGRQGTIRVHEAQDGEVICAGMGVVCPGRQCLEVVNVGNELKIKVAPPLPTDRYVPSGDRLFKSVAQACGAKTIGVILTGMGDDGTEGAKFIRNAGGIILAEAQETAVVFGMPGSAVRANVVTEVLPLPQIAERLAKLL